MRVVALYPAFDPHINEMAMVWQHLCSASDIVCLVQTATVDVLKGHTTPAENDTSANLTIRRFPEFPGAADILKEGVAFRPDVIFAAVISNLTPALALQERTGAPIILHTEYFFDDDTFLRRRYHFGIPFLRAAEGRLVRAYLHRRCAGILISNPVESRLPAWGRSPKLSYLPWPHPGQTTEPGHHTYDPSLSVHIGSLSRWKGVERLAQYYRAALEAFPDFRVLIIGPAVDTEARRAIDTLHASFPGRVELRTRCSRPEALELLRTSLCVLSPATHYGWGLIGDAWSSGTPVVSVKEHYDLLDEKNCLVASSAEDFVQCIRSLREGEDLRTNITAGGYVTAREHSPERVSEHLRAALERFGRT